MMFELTPRADARIMRLKHLCEEANILASSTANRIGALSRLLLNDPPDAASIKFEISQLQGTLSDHQMHANSLTQLLAQVQMFVQTFKQPVVDAPSFKVRLKNGDSILSALAGVRQHVAALDAELRTVQRASPTNEEQKAACDRWLETLPALSRPRIKAHKHDYFSAEFNDPASHTQRSPMASILYWMDPEGFRARLHADIDALPIPPLVLSAEKKAERIAEVRGLMLRAEREEASLIELGEREGQRVVIRPFMAPLALLGLAIKEKEPQREVA